MEDDGLHEPQLVRQRNVTPREGLSQPRPRGWGGGGGEDAKGEGSGGAGDEGASDFCLVAGGAGGAVVWIEREFSRRNRAGDCDQGKEREWRRRGGRRGGG